MPLEPRQPSGILMNKLNTPPQAQGLWDLDGDGRLNEVEQLMKKYDTDSSGNFSKAEVLNIVSDVIDKRRQLQYQKGLTKKMLCTILLNALLVLASLGAIFALQVLAIEEAKDNLIPDEVGSEPVLLAAGSNRVVQTAALSTALDLSDGFNSLLGLTPAMLSKINTITIPREWDPNNITHYVRIGGFSKMNSEQVSLYATAPAGLEISITADGVYAYVPGLLDPYKFNVPGEDDDDAAGRRRLSMLRHHDGSALELKYQPPRGRRKLLQGGVAVSIAVEDNLAATSAFKVLMEGLMNPVAARGRHCVKNVTYSPR